MNIVNYKGTNLRVSDIALGGGVNNSPDTLHAAPSPVPK